MNDAKKESLKAIFNVFRLNDNEIKLNRRSVSSKLEWDAVYRSWTKLNKLFIECQAVNFSSIRLSSLSASKLFVDQTLQHFVVKMTLPKNYCLCSRNEGLASVCALPQSSEGVRFQDQALDQENDFSFLLSKVENDDFFKRQHNLSFPSWESGHVCWTSFLVRAYN